MTRLVDDLDGSEAATTLSFSLDGHSYEIDLSEPHLVAFQQALAPFVTAARKLPGERRLRETTAAPTKAPARKRAPRRNGHAVPDADPNVPEAPTPRPAALDSPAFQHADRNEGSAGAPERAKPDRAPLVADPFNPQAHRG